MGANSLLKDHQLFGKIVKIGQPSQGLITQMNKLPFFLGGTGVDFEGGGGKIGAGISCSRLPHARHMLF